MRPLISICVPNLNTLPFLRERFDSIFQQTFSDWELFVYDSHSDDGSWEFIQEIASTDKRIRIVQGPREGVYPAWNECLRQTNGEYVYIATSDDSMSPDFLEKMIGALEEHRQCELAHSNLVIVNERGEKLTHLTWPECTVFADGSPEFLEIPHVRRAPYNGLLQLSGQHTILSITQVVIRRSIFSRTGNFPNWWGSISDFNWEMKAGLVANMVHVPDTFATWRIHSRQATASQDFASAEYFKKIDDMIHDAVSTCESYLPSAVQHAVKNNLVERARELRAYYRTLRQLRGNLFRRRLFQLDQMLRIKPVRREILGRMFGARPWTDHASTEMREWLESLGLQPLERCSLSYNFNVGDGRQRVKNGDYQNQ
jgi:glycosyltransferase involved in cell wall biosynthesis